MSVSGDEGTSEKKFQGGQMEGGGAQPPLKSTYLRKPSYIVIENNLLGKARLLPPPPSPPSPLSVARHSRRSYYQALVCQWNFDKGSNSNVHTVHYSDRGHSAECFKNKKSALAAPTFDDMLSCLLVDFWGVDLLRSCFLTG